MILSNVEIQKAIDEGRLIIEPDPQPRISSAGGQQSPYGTTSVDLHLGDTLALPTGGPFTYDLTQPGIALFLTRNSRQEKIGSGGYALEPNRLILGSTRERVCLPIVPGRPVLAARIEGKSSAARCGLLVHFTAPTVHAGFDGTLTLEMINLGPNKLSLFSDMAICQLIIEAVLGEPTPKMGQFQGQSTPAGV